METWITFLAPSSFRNCLASASEFKGWSGRDKTEYQNRQISLTDQIRHIKLVINHILTQSVSQTRLIGWDSLICSGYIYVHTVWIWGVPPADTPAATAHQMTLMMCNIHDLLNMENASEARTTWKKTIRKLLFAWFCVMYCKTMVSSWTQPSW